MIKVNTPASTKATGGSLAKAVEAMLPAIRGLIEEARRRAVTAANLSMVTLYWNVGRIINTELQRSPGRAEYGNQLVEQLAIRLQQEYGCGFSAANLWDMKRFQVAFQILQPVARESKILSPVAKESASPVVPSSLNLIPTAPFVIDFSKHYHIGWTHYRILLGIADARQRRFYFEQACIQRWSKRELQRQIAGALFERVALSKDTRALVKLETSKGPLELADYREAFKKQQHVELLLAAGPHKMHVSEYLTVLPNELILEQRLRLYGQLLEDGEAGLPQKAAEGAKSPS